MDTDTPSNSMLQYIEQVIFKLQKLSDKREYCFFFNVFFPHFQSNSRKLSICRYCHCNLYCVTYLQTTAFSDANNATKKERVNNLQVLLNALAVCHGPIFFLINCTHFPIFHLAVSSSSSSTLSMQIDAIDIVRIECNKTNIDTQI